MVGQVTPAKCSFTEVQKGVAVPVAATAMTAVAGSGLCACTRCAVLVFVEVHCAR
jgi:hypothetical protein